MTKKPSNPDEILDKISEIIEAHLGAISAAQAQAMHHEFHQLAAKSPRSSKPKSASKSKRSSKPRRKSRAFKKPSRA